MKTIQQEGLLQAGDKVVLGVSAGPDSMALLHVLVRLSPVLDITPAAAYVNHELRPAEAEDEKNLVAMEARRLGVAFFSGAADVKGLAAQQKISTEHAARLLRYDFLEKKAYEWGAQKIGLGHTADDQAEEIILRLIRGTARKGLSGMKTMRAGRFIRPFLRFPKSSLLDYLDFNSIPFMVDSSNTQNFYLRNRIRNDLLPYLEERYNPDIRQTLTRTAIILQDEEELLETITENALAETVTTVPERLTEKDDERLLPGESSLQELQLSLELFILQPRAIQRRLLEKCCWLMACEPRSRQIEHLLQLALAGSPDASLHLSEGLRVLKVKDQLCFAYPQGRGSFRGNLPAETETAIPETRIPAPGSYTFPALNKQLLVAEIKNAIPGSGTVFPAGEYLDAGLFSFPLTVRGPNTGDRFHPLGAPGSKKVSDFLSEQKIDLPARKRVPVLCVDDAILALPGFRIDHRYRITDKTTRAVRVIWEDMESEMQGEK